MTHYKLKHIYSGIVLNAIQTGAMLYILSLFLLNIKYNHIVIKTLYFIETYLLTKLVF